MRQNLAAVEEKFRGGAVDCLAGADTVSVVLIAVGIAAVGDFPQLPAHPLDMLQTQFLDTLL